ncbi:MAG: hypothetical protein J2P48_07660 [Alphaproteobacteria bacterium]|nr:hypothetical protein [Alphaproteobacteria bacterium]
MISFTKDELDVLRNLVAANVGSYRVRLREAGFRDEKKRLRVLRVIALDEQILEKIDRMDEQRRQPAEDYA